MRSYHNISDCWNTVVGMQSCIMWDMLQDPVNHVIHHPLVIAEFPPSTAFTQCLAPSWFAWKLQVFGLHSNAQITAQTEVRRGGFVGKVGMLSNNAFEMVSTDPAKIKVSGFNTKCDTLARSFLVLIMFAINWKKGRVSLHIGSRLPFCCFKFQLIAVVILILLSNSP